MTWAGVRIDASKAAASLSVVRKPLEIPPDCHQGATVQGREYKDRDIRRSKDLIANGILPVQSRIHLKSKVVSDS